jgi:AcrR family transcriptional regulator
MSKPDKHGEIVQAAITLIVEHGFHGATMSMIAEYAGVAAGTIYCYFENKEVLITEVYRELELKIKEGILDGYTTKKPLRERFHHLHKGLFHYFISFPLHFRYMEQFHNSPYGVLCRRNKIFNSGSKNVCVRLIEEGLAQRTLKDLPIPVHFSLAYGPLISVVRDHTLGNIKLNDALIENVADACWDGVKR